RIVLPPASAASLARLSRTYGGLIANVDIDPGKNVFCLYWRRSHEAIFRKTFKANEGINTISGANFGKFRTGSTSFYCHRELFVEMCRKHLNAPPINDDTLLFRELAERQPWTVHPEFRINWEPRDNYRDFLTHLYRRGPSFAEYHVFEHRSWF